MEKIQVMIVDDSAVVRQTMSSLLSEDPQIEVAATAADPIIAQHKLEKANPDVIILDIEMPRMDGLTFLKQLMHDRPIPIIICSSKTEKGSQNALKAMEYGAVEIIQKPKVGTKQFLEESKVTITDAVKAAKLSKVKKKTTITPIKSDVSKKLTSDVMLSKPKPDTSIETTEKVVVIGASTGGTEALRILLEMMPLNSPPLVIVQHMPEHFTTAFAERLNGLCSITVKEAKNNDSILRGQALIAPGNKHTLLKRSGARYYVEVKDGPLVSRHRPSVDVLFRSAARYGGKNILGVIMTGMGDDGANGMVEMKAAGAYNIAQDEASSVVFGMPNEAIKRGSVDSVVSLSKIADTILSKAK
jgi:two-component system chemotaxis response regulator CheB